MKQITDAAALLMAADALLKAGAAANALPDRAAWEREIAAGTLYGEEGPAGLLLLHRGGSFDRVQFLLHRDAVPEFAPERTTVVESPHRRGTEDLTARWKGFEPAMTRVRLTRPGGTCPVGDAPAAPDAATARRILAACFDPLTGCLPDEETLTAALAEGRLLQKDGGVLHYTVSGRTAELRHLAVLPACRGRGTAKKLVGAFLSQRGGGLCRVWTGADNDIALHLYHSFGFAEDGWVSDVKIFRKDDTQ